MSIERERERERERGEKTREVGEVPRMFLGCSR
jgi:hypothetical protein